jgi:uncharacterized protein
MTYEKETIIHRCELFVGNRISGYDSGHDWWHITRVRKLAGRINENEKLEDPFAVDIAALLHDAVDSKFSGENSEQEYQVVREFLALSGLKDIEERIIHIIKNVSFSNKIKTGDLTDPLLLIIQDADRLDAIGAIGVARAFNYGGFRNNIIYSPFEEENKKSTINHFYEKLLLLKSMMNTTTGKDLANERHEFLEIYLKQFYKEWDMGNH